MSTSQSFLSNGVALAFEPDHPCFTRITDSSTGALLYKVNSKSVQQPHKKAITVVQKASGETIAVFEWHDFKSDTVAFGDSPPIPTNDWLKKSVIPFRDTVSFKAESWKSFKWKGNGPGLSLELYAESNKSKPLAKFYKAVPTRPIAALVLDQNIASSPETRDHVVLAFLYLEKMRREQDEDGFDAMEIPTKGSTSRRGQ